MSFNEWYAISFLVPRVPGITELYELSQANSFYVNQAGYLAS